MSTEFIPVKTVKTDVLAAAGCLPVNCVLAGGKLYPALAPVPTNSVLPQDVACARYCPGINRYLVWADGKVYASTSAAASPVFCGSIESDYPFMAEEKTDDGYRAFVVGKDGAFVHMGMSNMGVVMQLNLTCGILHCGRLFGGDSTDAFKFRWSGEGGSFDWEESISGAGWAYPDAAPGKIQGIVELDGKLILVRANGLTTVSAYGTPENFAIGRDFFVPEIIAKTAAVVGGKLYFIAKGGLYRFIGSAVERVDDLLLSAVSSPVFGCAFGALYVVGCSHASLDGALYVYDTAASVSHLCSVPSAPTACCAAADLVVYGGGTSYKMERGGSQYTFESGKLDFGTEDCKVLERLAVDCDNDVEITISNGENSRIFGGVRGMLRPNMRGAAFHITVKGDCEIRSLTAYAEVPSGV